MQSERFPVVEWVPGGATRSLSVGRLWARWGCLVVLTEDRGGVRCERLPQGPAKECKRCDGLVLTGGVFFPCAFLDENGRQDEEGNP